MNRLNRNFFSFICSIYFVCSTNAFALAIQDWHQWMGPNRDNVWNETGILEQFPKNGPAVLWRTPIAGGYAGPAVANGRVYVADYVTNDNVKVDNFERGEFSGNERLLCLDETTGKILWEFKYPVKYTISYPAGPRCTPMVSEGKVYALGAEGDLICLTADSGEKVWTKQLREEYNTKSDLWGYAAHPLRYKDTLITLAGGQGSHVVAFNKDTGDEVWRSSTGSSQGYSPPTLIEAGGKTQLILAKPDSVSAVDPDNGNEYWSVPYLATSGSIIMSPIKVGDFLYVAGFNKQSLLLKLKSGEPGVEEVWRNRAKDAMSPVNVQPFLDQEILFGVDQDGQLMAVKLPEGKRLWSTSSPISQRPQSSGTAFIVRQADRFWLFNDSGELMIARMNAKGYEEIDRAKVIDPTNVAFGREVVWSMPAFCNRHAYLRNDKEIICVDLSADQSK
jgi:outer membrane protein assembly factor BamB